MFLRLGIQSLALVALLSSTQLLGQPDAVRTFSLSRSADLETHHLKAEAVEYLGRKALRLTTETQNDESGFAFLPGVDFADGTIEADLAVRLTTPPAVRMPGFLGVAFRSNADGSEYELFYLRPKNALADDQAMRNHAVQYSAEPHHGWYRLRREWPFVYESYADIQPETWIKMKIEVAGRTARLFLNGSTNPTLVVDGLKSSNLHGKIALWGYSGEESYFSNVRITPSPALPVKNGSDVAGAWDLKYASDAGRFAGTLTLTRTGNDLAGTWSGDLGDSRPVKGTWRDGYVELSFPGDWPAEHDGAPGPVSVAIAGWFDGDTGKGRMEVVGRADGIWSAQQKAP
ncbi:MAG: hypothetical protein WCC26_08740 [Terracidiphilus sp.]